MIETADTVRNAGYYETAYAIFWAIFFSYLIYLHLKLRRLEKSERP